jgi:hypothetical protein
MYEKDKKRNDETKGDAVLGGITLFSAQAMKKQITLAQPRSCKDGREEGLPLFYDFNT